MLHQHVSLIFSTHMPLFSNIFLKVRFPGQPSLKLQWQNRAIADQLKDNPIISC